MQMIKLTQQQIQYLMYIEKNREDISLKRLAIAFTCSKVNAKNIIDRMVKAGLLFKENNRIQITHVGESVAKQYWEEQKDIVALLKTGLNVEENVEKLAMDFISSLNEDSKEVLLRRGRICRNLEKLQDTQVENAKIFSFMSKDTINVSIAIFKSRGERVDAFNPISMSMQAFHLLGEIDKIEKVIRLKIDPIKRSLSGFIVQGLLKEIGVYREKEKMRYSVENGQCEVPIDYVEYWQYIGQGIFQASLSLEIQANIGFCKIHAHEAEFIFTLNFMQE